ncbi:MAG: NAD(+)/NADH kinase [Ruminococcaceae bacterium]|nr:NAD(+)/NADH kinase [Oscillospiraceae bacterium]
MNVKIEKIAIVTNYNIPDKLAAAVEVAQKLSTYSKELYIPEIFKERIFRSHNHKSYFTYVSYDDIYSKSDLVVAIGGDGVMLEAARRSTPCGIPILGVNMGRVGYMTELEMNELDLLDKIFKDDFYLDERAMLRVDIRSNKGQSRFSAYALNEAVIAKGATARIIDLELSDSGRLVSEYRADGIVVATPTGSTAYSLSAGGPIVDPKLSCFCVTPICPHSLVARPLIFPDSAILEIKNICVREKVLHLTVDGKATFDLFFGDTVVITKAAISTKLLRIKDDDFYSKIRMKKFI